MRKSKPGNSGFTIIELMVVITIIVLLVAILIPVISKARNSSRHAATLAQMEHIKQACEHYHADFSAYPGPVDDASMDGVATFSGAQNLYLGLTRRFYPVAPTNPPALTWFKVQFSVGTTTSIWFDGDPNKQLANYSALFSEKFGALTIPSPTPVGTIPFDTFDGYLAPKPSETSNAGTATRLGSSLDLQNLPCFVDAAFGGESMPILYYRQAYKWDSENAAALAANGTGGPANTTPYADKIVMDKASTGHAVYYANNNTLVYPGGGIPTATASPPVPALDALVTDTVGGNPVPKRGFVLISAGVDRVYGTSDDIILSGD